MSIINFQVSGHDVSVRQRDETEGYARGGGVDITIDGRFPPISILIGPDSFHLLVEGQVGQPVPLKPRDDHHHHHNDKTETIDIGLLFSAVRKLEHDVIDIYQRLKGR